MNDSLPTKRSPYIVTVRCMATGTDYTNFEVMARHVRLAFGIERDALRLVEIV